jgi:hypothetical protein
MPGIYVPPAAETVDELRERLLKRSEDLARDLPYLEQQYGQRLVSDQGIVYDYLHGHVGLHIYLGFSGSGVAPAADYCLAVRSCGEHVRMGDISQVSPGDSEGVPGLTEVVSDWADQAVTVETGQLMEPPQFLWPSRVRLYRLDKAETVLRESSDTVLLLESPRVVEYWKLNPVGFTGTVNKRDLVGGVIERGPHVANGRADPLGPEHQVRALQDVENDLASGVVRVTLGFYGVRLTLTKTIDLGLERFGFFVRPIEALPSIGEWAGRHAAPRQI